MEAKRSTLHTADIRHTTLCKWRMLALLLVSIPSFPPPPRKRLCWHTNTARDSKLSVQSG